MAIRRLVGRLNSALILFGVNVRQGVLAARGLGPFFADLRAYKRAVRGQGSIPPPLGKLYPCLTDRYASSGTAGGHYFHQDLLVARRVFARNPAVHVDVGSRIDGFVAHVAVFRPLLVVDVRDQTSTIPNVRFQTADLMAPLPDPLRGCCDSLSCLHALEHFGLGRYGDPIRPDGHLVGLRNLAAMLTAGGTLYLSVPIGPLRTEFNGQRVFSIGYLSAAFDGLFRVAGFSYVDDAGDLHEAAELTPEAIGTSCGCRYGCGIFELTKL
jgi:hypothetical protein